MIKVFSINDFRKTNIELIDNVLNEYTMIDPKVTMETVNDIFKSLYDCGVIPGLLKFNINTNNIEKMDMIKTKISGLNELSNMNSAGSMSKNIFNRDITKLKEEISKLDGNNVVLMVIDYEDSLIGSMEYDLKKHIMKSKLNNK